MTSPLRNFPTWRTKRLKNRLQLDKSLQNWAFDPASLTEKLRQTCPELEVRVLSEKWEKPLRDEQKRLNMQPEERAWVRVITLSCGKVDLIYARTVIPNFSLGNAWFSIKALGKTPLGHVLFQATRKQVFSRSEFECTNQTINCPHFSKSVVKQIKKGNSLTARRCEFIKKGNSLLLTEVFLPTVKF